MWVKAGAESRICVPREPRPSPIPRSQRCPRAARPGPELRGRGAAGPALPADRDGPGQPGTAREPRAERRTHLAGCPCRERDPGPLCPGWGGSSLCCRRPCADRSVRAPARRGRGRCRLCCPLRLGGASGGGRGAAAGGGQDLNEGR